MSFDIPRGRVLPVDRLDVRLDPGPHPFAVAHADRIATNWAAEQARNPALFDGEIALLSALTWRDGLLTGRCHIAPYSAFLLWHRVQPVDSAEHAFAHAMPVGSDGSLLAIRMAPHTLNAGTVYFAAGSFEPVDFQDGQVDVPFNMRREVLEETGLDILEAQADDRFHCWSGPKGTVIFRRYRFADTADCLARRVADFIAAEAESEVSEAVVIRKGEGRPERMQPHMPAMLDWHFASLS